MLTSLSIRNIVLIDKLDLTFEQGLSVLTGETGAGKSILLDALGLALGHKAEARLLRKGAEQAIVTAVFDVGDDHPAVREAEGNGIECDGDDLILRRVLGDDGRTRAFVNDQPVSVGLLRRVGEHLVEVHGQFETQRLIEPASHRGLLDAFAGNDAALADVAAAYKTWRDINAALSAAEEAQRMARENEEFVRHAVDELRALAPQPGEESALAEQRKILQYQEQISAAMTEAQEALNADEGVEVMLSRALDALERAQSKAGGKLDDTIAALGRAISETADTSGFLERAASDLELDPAALEDAEERLFALRALARKHGVDVDHLADIQAKLERDLDGIEGGDGTLKRLRAEADKAAKDYASAAKVLHDRRVAAGAKLDKAMTGELGPLKMEKARFATSVAAEAADKWSATGADRVEFAVATNPGADPGPLAKIASGGEMARFMLALKVVLAEADPVPVLVFDEVDAGIGGAVASAVGERLALLGRGVQVFVVTHSPQVAAKGKGHFSVRKGESDGNSRTEVVPLNDDDRLEEIARMLAGENVTGEARAAAARLLEEASE
jgi:DNA repair protein RecN (Recombination protein N)